ncbi:MAG: DUF5666 domain-containing protein [Thermaerobacter sp.]|nr:DUF5666 domain-containing protein [Thermaerobacter sp.]
MKMRRFVPVVLPLLAGALLLAGCGAAPASSAVSNTPAVHHHHRVKKPSGVAGTVSSLASTGFQLTTAKGVAWTVQVSSGTVYRQGKGKVTFSTLMNGQRVRVLGKRDKTTHTIQAKAVRILPSKAATGTTTG